MRTTAIDGIIASGYDNADGWFLFNTLLFILLCLNVRARPTTRTCTPTRLGAHLVVCALCLHAQTWWFTIIVKIMWRSITSQSLQALDDIREKEGSTELKEANKEANSGGERLAITPQKCGSPSVVLAPHYFVSFPPTREARRS